MDINDENSVVLVIFMYIYMDIASNVIKYRSKSVS